MDSYAQENASFVTRRAREHLAAASSEWRAIVEAAVEVLASRQARS